MFTVRNREINASRFSGTEQAFSSAHLLLPHLAVRTYQHVTHIGEFRTSQNKISLNNRLSSFDLRFRKKHLKQQYPVSYKEKRHIALYRKKKYSARAPIMYPFRTPPNASTFREALFFDHFWVDPAALNVIVATHKSSDVSRFFRRRVKTSGNAIPELIWPEN